MKRLLWAVVFMTGMFGGSVAQAADAPAPKLQAGFADRDITPDIGMEQPGGYGKAFHRTLHDPCKVRAAVFGDGTNRVALVCVDALLVRRKTVLAARERIEKACGIPAGAILIHATHSHSSGPTGMILPGEYDGAPEAIQKLAYEESSCADPVYLKKVEDQIVDAVTAADASRKAAKATVGRGHEDKIAFNRRFFMKNGLTYTHPGAGNPDIIEPAGPIDPEVGVIGVWDADQNLVGCVVNYACHATTNPGGISANYIQYVEQVIRGVFGEQVVVVYLNGASGDITQVDNLRKTENPKSEQWSRMVGGCIGAEAVKVLLREEPGDLFPVAALSKTWNIPRRKPSAETVANAQRIVDLGKQADRTELTFAKETLMLNYLCEAKPEVEVEVQDIQVGPVVICSDPAEYFVEYGLRIKKESPFPFTFPVSLSNGCVGYVPTLEAFGPRGGGYETRLTSYSNLDITAGTQFADVAIELSKQLKPGAVPSRAPIPTQKPAPWGYGNLPPQLK